MATADTAMRIERLLENDYAQEQLHDGMKNLRAAYERARKRRVKPASDKRLRRQVQAAKGSLTEAANAFRSDRQKPKPRWGRRLLIAGGVGAVGVGAALAVGKSMGGEDAGFEDGGQQNTSGEAGAPGSIEDAGQAEGAEGKGV